MGLCLMKRAIRWASPLAMSWTLAQLLKVARTRRWVVLMLDSDESDFRLWLVSRIDHCCGTCILWCLEGLMQFRLFQHNVCSPAKNSCCRCVWCGKQDQHAFVCCHLKELPESCLLQFLEVVIDQLLLVQSEPGYGADVLRLWVSSVDYTGDVLVGPQILRQMSDVYRKLRGTLRYLLSNLHDWKVISVSCCHFSLHTSEFLSDFLVPWFPWAWAGKLKSQVPIDCGR